LIINFFIGRKNSGTIIPNYISEPEQQTTTIMRSKKNGQVKSPAKSKKTKVGGFAEKSKGPRAKRTSGTSSRRGLNETPDTDSIEDYEEIDSAYDENEVANESHDIEDIEERDNDDDEWSDTLYSERDEVESNDDPDKTSPDKDNDNTEPEQNPDIKAK
jgi:hypothetical protein